MNHSRYLKIGASIAVWLFIGLVFAGQLQLLSLTNGFKMGLREVVSWELTRWLLWIFLVPWIIRLSRRYPVYPVLQKRTLGIHIAASVGLSFFHLLLFTVVYEFVNRVLHAAIQNQSLWQALVILKAAIVKTPLNLFPVFRGIFILDFHIGILVYGAILLGHQVMEASRRSAELKTKLAGAQLDALKMQLHPHFLFNTLNSISALLQKNPDAADEMIGELGNFLRLTLKNPGKHEVRLEEELNFLKSYLEIERVRFQDRLTVNMNIANETLNAQVPNMILQPLIENAIRHAIAPAARPGTIEVNAERRNGRLLLSISDNGPGMPATPGNGIGLQNVRERLQQLYGADHQFKLVNRSPVGLSAEIEIPFRVATGGEGNDGTT